MRLFVIKTSVIYMTVEDKSGVDQDMTISRALCLIIHFRLIKCSVILVGSLHSNVSLQDDADFSTRLLY